MDKNKLVSISLVEYSSIAIYIKSFVPSLAGEKNYGPYEPATIEYWKSV